MIVKPNFTDTDAMAMQALAAGKASEAQQKIALTWIMTEGCRIWDDNTDIAEADREVIHAAGRRYVGVWINRLVNANAPSPVTRTK